MPTPPSQRPPGHHRVRPAAVKPRLALFVAAGAAALAGAWIAYALNAAAPAAAVSFVDQPPASLPQPAAAPAPSAALRPIAPAASGRPPPAWLKPANDPSPSLTLAELQELQQALTAPSEPGDPFARLPEQMLLADATRRFLQLRSSAHPDLEELHGLVELIGPLLDAQLARGALTRAEAIELKLKLLQVRYPQPSMQQGELTRWLATPPAR